MTTLNANAQDYTWVAAGIGSMSTAGYQLATGNPVMPIGGFNGSDPRPPWSSSSSTSPITRSTIHRRQRLRPIQRRIELQR